MQSEVKAILKIFPFLRGYTGEVDAYSVRLTTKTQTETDELFKNQNPVEIHRHYSGNTLVEDIFLLDDQKRLLRKVGDRWAGKTAFWLLLRIPLFLAGMVIGGMVIIMTLATGDPDPRNLFFLEEPFPETLEAATRRSRRPVKYILVMMVHRGEVKLLDLELFKIEDEVNFQQRTRYEFEEKKRWSRIKKALARKRLHKKRLALAAEEIRKNNEEKKKLERALMNFDQQVTGTDTQAKKQG